MSRWDRLLETKPVPLIDQLLTEVAKLIAKDLSTWPLPIREVDPAVGASLTAVLESDARPSPGAFAEAFRLTRWELRREVEAVDEYMRNRRWMSVGLGREDKHRILFVSRWLVEQLLALRESTNSRVSRADLLECLDRTQRYFAPAGVGARDKI